MSFIDDRLLECVSYGTVGGPTWNTRKVALRSGIIARNANRSLPLYHYDILYQNILQSDHRNVVNAFNACMGGLHSFRLKDWHDFEADDEVLEDLGTGAEQVVQLTKAYIFGNQTLYRLIRKPVSGTVTMTQNSIAMSALINYTTGEATFTAPLNAVIRWSGEFDVPVMFEEDKLPFSGDNRTAGEFILNGNVPLVEDRSV